MKNRIIKLLPVLFSMALLISCSSSPAEPVVLGKADKYFKKEGLKKTIEQWEDGIRAPLGPGTFEWWYFDAHLDDGSIVVIVFFTKSMVDINSDTKPYVSCRITAPDGTGYVKEAHFPADSLKVSKEKCDIVLGKNSVNGDLKTYTLHTEIDDTKCDLEFKRLVPSWRPGTGKWYFGKDEDKYFAWFPSVPYGSVKGTMTYNGKKHVVKGSGYHDHNWGNVEMSKVWNNWWWSRSQIGGYTNLAVELITTKKYGNVKLPIFMLAKNNKILLDNESKMVLNRKGIVIHPTSGKNVENKLQFLYKDGTNRVTVELERKRDILVFDLLKRIPSWKGAVAKVLNIRPWYHRIHGSVTLDMDLGGKKERYESESVYELMFLGKNLR